MANFNRVRAREYALDWCQKRNPAFPDYSSSNGGGGDCTNFVSQVMLAGGWTVSWGSLLSPTSWWSGNKKSTYSWSVAQTFRIYLGMSKRAALCEASDLAWGDILFVVPRSLGSNKAAHAMVVTRVGRRSHPWDDVYLCGHSNDRRDMPLKNVGSPENLEFWHVSDVIPAFYNFKIPGTFVIDEYRYFNVREKL